jgi:hypothetical protein
MSYFSDLQDKLTIALNNKANIKNALNTAGFNVLTDDMSQWPAIIENHLHIENVQWVITALQDILQTGNAPEVGYVEERWPVIQWDIESDENTAMSTTPDGVFPEDAITATPFDLITWHDQLLHHCYDTTKTPTIPYTDTNLNALQVLSDLINDNPSSITVDTPQIDRIPRAPKTYTDKIHDVGNDPDVPFSTGPDDSPPLTQITFIQDNIYAALLDITQTKQPQYTTLLDDVTDYIDEIANNTNPPVFSAIWPPVSVTYRVPRTYSSISFTVGEDDGTPWVTGPYVEEVSAEPFYDKVFSSLAGITQDPKLTESTAELDDLEGILREGNPIYIDVTEEQKEVKPRTQRTYESISFTVGEDNGAPIATIDLEGSVLAGEPPYYYNGELIAGEEN